MAFDYGVFGQRVGEGFADAGRVSADAILEFKQQQEEKKRLEQENALRKEDMAWKRNVYADEKELRDLQKSEIQRKAQEATTGAATSANVSKTISDILGGGSGSTVPQATAPEPQGSTPTATGTQEDTSYLEAILSGVGGTTAPKATTPGIGLGASSRPSAIPSPTIGAPKPQAAATMPIPTTQTQATGWAAQKADLMGKLQRLAPLAGNDQADKAIKMIQDQLKFGQDTEDKRLQDSTSGYRWDKEQEYKEKQLALEREKAAKTGQNSGNKTDFTQEQQLRTQFDGLTKDFRTIRDSYKRIETAAKNSTPAGDLSLIYNYMRINDPTSTVRESEFAAAASAGSFGDKIKAATNRVISGKRLSEDQRKDFMNTAKMLLDSQKGSYEQVKRKYTDIAKKYQLDPELIVSGFDLEDTVGGETQPAQAEQITAEDQQAIEWAKANSNDPRAKKILQLHGM